MSGLIANSSTATVVVEVTELSVGYMVTRHRYFPVIRDVNLTIRTGERVGLIGDSGAGKSTLARVLCGLIPARQITAGSVHYKEQQANKSDKDKDKDNSDAQRSNSGYIFQNPYGCLNPTMTIGAILREQMRVSDRTRRTPLSDTATPSPRARLVAAVPPTVNAIAAAAAISPTVATESIRQQYDQEAAALLRRLDFTEPEQLLLRLPHQLSRGMCQRIAIALNMITRPRLLICDEPTSALDSDAERQVCQTLRTTEIAAALLFITHNIQLAMELCDRILILEDGRIVDDCSVEKLQRGKQRSERAEATIEYLTAAKHIASVTRQLQQKSASRITAASSADSADPHTSSTPRSAATPPATTGTSSKRGSTLVRLSGVHFAYRLRAPNGVTRRGPEVLRDLSLTIAHRDSVGIVGKSGSGKSTLLGVLSALLRPQAGEYAFVDQWLFNQRALNRTTLAILRRELQVIPQDPSESLAPFQSIEQIIAEPLRLQMRWRKRNRRTATNTRAGAGASIMSEADNIQARVRAVADEAGVAVALLSRYPQELSVGQQQRVLIARALILSPTLILADEPFSALDSRMQARLISLLQQLQRERDLSLCIVSHRPEVLDALSQQHYRLRDGQLEPINAVMRPRPPRPRPTTDSE